MNQRGKGGTFAPVPPRTRRIVIDAQGENYNSSSDRLIGISSPICIPCCIWALRTLGRWTERETQPESSARWQKTARSRPAGTDLRPPLVQLETGFGRLTGTSGPQKRSNSSVDLNPRFSSSQQHSPGLSHAGQARPDIH